MKNSFQLLCAILLFLTFLPGCKKELEGESYDPENSTDTNTREIEYQVRRTWRIPEAGISVSNEFTGARLNDFIHVKDSLYEAVINPENEPVNKSPWYAFAIWSEKPQEIAIKMSYFGDYTHRYYPEISHDLINWSHADSASFVQDTVSNITTLHVEVGPDTLYISAQEILTSADVYSMVQNLDTLNYIESSTIGYSRLGKPIPLMNIGNKESRNAIVVLGRQHPPETTGYLAMKAFLKSITSPDDALASEFREKFNILVFPMLNPDGVDNGHWRHNAGGIDLNRDWQYFRQPETAAVKGFVENYMNREGQRIIFEIDFHSTQEDLFYVFDREQPSILTGFTHQWLDSIENDLPWYVADRVPTSGNSPVSTQWFYSNFNTEAVTYEVGDDSPRDKINEISETAAKEMMKILLVRQPAE